MSKKRFNLQTEKKTPRVDLDMKKKKKKKTNGEKDVLARGRGRRRGKRKRPLNGRERMWSVLKLGPTAIWNGIGGAS